MNFEVCVLGGLFLVIFSLSAFSLLAFMGEVLSCIKMLSAKIDRVSSAVMELTESLSQEHKSLFFHVTEKAKDEIATEIMRELIKKDGKLKKHIVREVVSKVSVEMKK